ncbi:LOW QUALITY PROTEIN: hypothetical protein U9M48_004864 [Paspalum notatum var. saurae]|uniref:F-box protein AT5G49610-like beta-propeller domain-containing protein n=1 Tax=Paspalum notatum var. saurae TaxID=547442 RepID=A0AAQ3SHZ8_PASNO
MLGFLYNTRPSDDNDGRAVARFVPMSASRVRPADRISHRALDSRHGRVLLVDDDVYSSSSTFVVCVPVADERRVLPKPPLRCGALRLRRCCRRRVQPPGLPRRALRRGARGHYALDRDHLLLCLLVAASAWGEPVYGPHSDYVIGGRPRSALVGNALYFVFEGNKTILEYNLGLRAMSVIELPREQTQPFIKLFGPVELTTTVDGRLGFARVEKSRLCVWSMEEAGGARWALRQAIELEKVLPLPAKWTSKLFLAGSAEGVGVIFVTVEYQLFTVDLRKCGQATKIYEHPRLSNAMVVPYMSFFIPGTLLRSKPPPPAPAPTTISAIGDDLLREIFLRLPSLPTLVRAALTCRAFLNAVRSSPPSPPPLPVRPPAAAPGPLLRPRRPRHPSFAPLRRRSGPDLTAAVRGADFFLTRLPDADDAAPEIRDCRGGYVLLTNLAGRVAVYNPLTRALDLLPAARGDRRRLRRLLHLPRLPRRRLGRGAGGVPRRLHQPRRVTDARRRLLLLRRQLQQGVADPAVGAAGRAARPEDEKYWLHSGELVGESIYWTHTSKACMLVLDTAAMRFSRIDIPPYLQGQGHTFRPGETKDGKPCIVCAMEFTLLVWYRRVDVDDGVDKWMLDKMYHLQTEIVQATQGLLEYHGAIKVLEIMEGIVYLSTSETFNDPNFPCWFLTFCLETGELTKLFQRKFDSHGVYAISCGRVSLFLVHPLAISFSIKAISSLSYLPATLSRHPLFSLLAAES